MTNIEKIFDIANARGIDASKLYGMCEVLKEILIHQDVELAEHFLIDTFMMLEDEITHAHDELGLSEDVA